MASRTAPCRANGAGRGAGEAGAVVVFPESLYSYSEPERPMVETGPRTATGGKRGVRTALLKARDASATNAVSVVAGDFFGPRVRTSHAGERLVPAVLAGKKLWVIGSTDQPHSFTYVADLAAAMIHAAGTPSLWNKVWHAPTDPAVTQRQLATAFTEAFTEAGGVSQPKVGPFRAGRSGPWGCSRRTCGNWRNCSTSSSSRL
ncbi:hypothetical protein AHiyo4_47920 [Arthrobacter sp. Hiyo4]|nr:hypothetical protein AHiyo4_47920 [Arthrobacter sp. Hiyo4]